ncbi:MAG: mechanosensitive ion channel family protein [Crocinitomicaceae bacterium]|nr:mechanosensitive ion channel family protein [Crocinitomicaceae bacterium]
MSWGIQHSDQEPRMVPEISIPNGVEVPDALNFVESWSIAWPLFWIIIGLGSLAFFWLIKNFVTLRVKSRLRKRKLDRLVFILEILTYSFVLLFLLYAILSFNFIVFGAILILVLFFSHSLILNFFYGVVFKLKNAFTIGDQIAINQVSGEIQELRTFAMIINNEHDDVVYVPYAKLKDEILLKQHSQGKIQSMTITLEMDNETILTLQENGINWLSNCPWVIGREGISVKKNSDNSISFSFQTVNIEFKSRIVAFLQNKLEK